MLHETEPLERFPEAPPFGLHLIGGENAVGIGADGEKGGIAEVEKPRETHNDIEAERQDREGECVRCRVDITLVAVDQGKEDAKHEQHDDEGAPLGCALQPFPDGRHDPVRDAEPRSHESRWFGWNCVHIRFSGFRRRRSAEQARRSEDQHHHQYREDDHVGPAHLEILASE
jgi:hypothetical protein